MQGPRPMRALRSSRIKMRALLVLMALAAVPAGAAELQWSWRVEAASADEVELVFVAQIPAGWILYSSDFKADLGPRPAQFTFGPAEVIELRGPVQAVSSQKAQDRTWKTDYTYFAKRAEFRQKAKPLQAGATVEARVEGQTCHEADGLCELFRESFSVKVQ